MTNLSNYSWLKRLTLITVFSHCFTMAVSAQEGTLIVANRLGGSVSFIDMAERVEVGRVPIGPVIPHEIDVSPDGKLALTTEYGQDSDHGRYLVVMDVASASITGRIDLGPNSRPHSIEFLPDGRHAIATMQDSDLVALIDIEAQRVLETFPTGGREGHNVHLSPDASRAYVTSRGAEGTLSVVFLEEERSPVVIETGLGAEGMDVTNNGSEVWVVNRRVQTISVIDTRSLEIVATIPTPNNVNRIAISESGLALLPIRSVNDNSSDRLQILDVDSRTVINEIDIPLGVATVLIEDGTVFFSDQFEGTVQMFSLENFTSELLAANQEQPDGIAWSPVRVSAME